MSSSPVAVNRQIVLASRPKRRGTPLIEPHPSGDGYSATFLFRVPISEITRRGNYKAVKLVFECHCPYTRSVYPLDYIDGTTVWYTEVQLPRDFSGVYCFNLYDAGGLITEDIHEPWPMSFVDEFNPHRGTEYDAIYPRNLISAAPPPEADRNSVPKGTVVDIAVDAHLLNPPYLSRDRNFDAENAQGRHHVWAYMPPNAHTSGERLPCVLLLNGQFLAHVDLAASFDAALAAGRIPPTVVVTSGSNNHNYNAWGWRAPYGPPPMGDFLTQALLPTLSAALPIQPPLHVIAFGPAAVSAVATASETPHLVGSVTMLCPYRSIELSDWPGRSWEDVAIDIFEGKGDVLRWISVLGNVRLLVGWPSPRTDDFAWSDEVVSDIVSLMPQAARLTLSDPHIYAAVDTVIEAIDATCR